MITELIQLSNYERIRSQIASILVLELANQKQLNIDAKAEEEAKETPDQSLINLYDTNIECIPDIVYAERIDRLNENDKGKMINVYMASNSLDDLVTLSTQIGEVKYYIEVFQEAKSINGRDGDYYSSIKVHRLLGIIRSIIMDSTYVALGFTDGYVKGRMLSNMEIAQPKDGIDNPYNTVMGNIELTVRIQEDNIVNGGVPLLENNTDIKINGESGYEWEYNATEYTIDTPLDPDAGISEYTAFTET